MTKCWLYARISEDPREQRRGVERQLRDLRAHARKHGWEICGEFSDNDLSAHKDEERPGYDQVMAAVIEAAPDLVKAGEQVVLLGYHPSRVWRRRVERAQAIEDLRRAKVCVAFEAGGFFDMTKATERSQLSQVGESDTLESEVKSERVAREALARAEEGRANAGVQYGWRRIYEFDKRGKVIGFTDVKDEEFGPIVEEVIDRLDRAESQRKITEDMNRRRIPPPGADLTFKKKKRAPGNEDGMRWGNTTVKKLALRPANAGLRVHHGELFPAAWPALVAREKWERVCVRLTDPARSKLVDGQRKHLLSWGIGECGVCDDRLRVARKGKSRAPLYVCDGVGCVGRNEAYVDEWTGAVVCARLARPDAVLVFGGDEDAAAAELEKAEGLRHRLNEAAEEYADGVLTRAQLSQITKRLKARIAEHEAESKRLRPDTALLDGILGAPLEEAEARWAALDVVQKRAVLEILNVRVRILPVARGGPGFDPDTVLILTKDGQEFADFVPAS